ncbi:MAG: HAMP domain-containing histidine kinase, partial [Deltaproteobacteria bacterium]|nr:HAMP domain-containing histidine kinase [Deltaproteobacteria bacterium]
MTGKYTKFLQSVDRSIHHAHIYGARHPLAHRSISDTYNHIMKLLTDNCELSMSFADWKILVNSQPQDSGDEIAILFHKLKLNNIVFYQEIKFEELVTLFSALNLENGMIAGEDFSNKGIGHINVNKAHSKKTDEDLDVKQWLDDFVSNVTHELITPVASVKQSLSNILNLTNGLTLDQQKMLGVALRNTERLSRLINNILDFSMAGSGSIQIRQEIVDCNLLLEDVVSTMKCLADVKRIKLCLGLPNVIPKLFVDRDRIIQVF